MKQSNTIWLQVENKPREYYINILFNIQSLLFVGYFIVT